MPDNNQEQTTDAAMTAQQEAHDDQGKAQVERLAAHFHADKGVQEIKEHLAVLSYQYYASDRRFDKVESQLGSMARETNEKLDIIGRDVTKIIAHSEDRDTRITDLGGRLASLECESQQRKGQAAMRATIWTVFLGVAGILTNIKFHWVSFFTHHK